MCVQPTLRTLVARAGGGATTRNPKFVPNQTDKDITRDHEKAHPQNGFELA